MRRLYSHYTFIYPDIYLKNCVVELDDSNRIVRYFPFSGEIAKTEFYSGLLSFIPNDVIHPQLVDFNAECYKEIESEVCIKDSVIYKIVFDD